LHQPGQPLPAPWSRGDVAWNGRLVYVFGGGCGAGYRQGTLPNPATDDVLIATGYALATSTLNIFRNNCNDVVSAETLSMVKEHFIKTYGVPVHTIGWGGSGGAMQLYLIVQDYPGLIDGIIPSESFPDVLTWVSAAVGDCRLLLHAFDGMRSPLTDKQKSAVTGFATWRTCLLGNPVMASRNCSDIIPRADVYDARRRRKGVRCDLYDNELNVFGRDPATGFAARPLDNAGVQYGLVALRRGEIDTEQFIEINERVGGYSIDGEFTNARMRADERVVRDAYRHGQILTGGGGLAATPIIDWRSYADDLGDPHDSVRSFATRERLTAANGSAQNQVIITFPRLIWVDEVTDDPDPETSLKATRERYLVRQMDHWLDQIAADTGSGTPSEKAVRDRPADVIDTCWATDGERFAGKDVYSEGGQCGKLYPQHADPRIVAGGPVAGDILKCALRPVADTGYPQPLTAKQIQRLKAVFPDGVCAYDRPGIGKEVTRTTWQRY